MVERHLVIDRLKFSYEGLFNAAELYQLISSYFFEKGWDWYEKTNDEQVTPGGKQVLIILEPWKNISDYYKLKVRINLLMTDVKEVEVEHEGQTIRTNQGIVHFTIDGFVISDRKGKWTSGQKIWQWLFIIVMEKYFYRNHLEKFSTWIKSDVEDLLYKIKTYLNTYKYTYQS